MVPTLLLILFATTWAEAQTTIYWKKDHIRDASGAAIAVATPAPSDNQAPSVPGNPSESTITTTSIAFSWGASSDTGGSGLAGYLIYRGAIPVGAVPYTASGFTDVGLVPNTTYSYRVVAFDNVHNYSGYSGALVKTTNAMPSAPLNLTATAVSASQINVTWSAPGSGAPHHYGIWRRSNGSLLKIDTSTSSSYADTAVSPGIAYLYKVSAEDSSNLVQGWTNADIATTVFFTDDPLTAGSTVIKAAHVTELRTAVNAVRAAAGLTAANWSNSSLNGAWIKARDIYELRAGLGDALNVLGLPAPNYTDSTLMNYTVNPPLGVSVKKAHIDEIRQHVK